MAYGIIINIIVTCSRVFLERLVISQLFQQLHTFYGTRQFNSVSKSVSISLVTLKLRSSKCVWRAEV